jgi:hypothetical protein
MNYKYQAGLLKALKQFTDSCDAMAELARVHEIHPDHVEYAQSLTRKRSADLKKELEFEHVGIEIELPAIGTDKKSDAKTQEKTSGMDKQPESPMAGGFNSLDKKD